jgi:hypothetical protein
MGQQAYGKGVIDRSTLLSAVEVAIAPTDERLVQ